MAYRAPQRLGDRTRLIRLDGPDQPMVQGKPLTLGDRARLLAHAAAKPLRKRPWFRSVEAAATAGYAYRANDSSPWMCPTCLTPLEAHGCRYHVLFPQADEADLEPGVEP